ncbi:MAG: hypothetical protein M3270_09580 [Thermoproteota archaeon]|nr:hypothetical protein [Thermoproteota archaeon]
MRANPMLWLVPAGIVLAFGIATTTMATIDHKLTLQKAGPDIIVIGGTCGIASGLIVIVLGYYSEMKPSSKMKTIFTMVKIWKIGSNYSEDSERKFHLDRVSHNTLQLTKNLVRLGNLIRGYKVESPPKDWQIVRYNATRSREDVEELCKRIILDFAQIVDLIENPRLVDLFGIKTLYHCWDLIDQTLKIDPRNDKKLLIELRREIRRQVEQLERALKLLDQEKKRINDY